MRPIRMLDQGGSMKLVKELPDSDSQEDWLARERAHLSQVFVANSGAEAVEGAIKLARYTTGRPGLIAFQGAFHGRTYGALSLTASKGYYRERYEPLLPAIYHVPYPYPYRNPTGTDEAATLDYVFNFIDEMLDTRVPPKNIAAFIVEPVLGEGGYVVPPPAFMPRLRALCDRH